MSEEAASYCHECKRPLTEIDNRGQILQGCLSCNIWCQALVKRCGCLRRTYTRFIS
jgi:hypothetical protein